MPIEIPSPKAVFKAVTAKATSTSKPNLLARTVGKIDDRVDALANKVGDGVDALTDKFVPAPFRRGEGPKVDVFNAAKDWMSDRVFNKLKPDGAPEKLEGANRVAYGPLNPPPKLARPVVMIPGLTMPAQSFDRLGDRLAEGKGNGPVVVYVASEDKFRLGDVQGKEATAAQVEDAKLFQIEFRDPWAASTKKAPQIARAMARIAEATGAPSLDVVAHSAGGTDFRLYLDGRDPSKGPKIENAALIGPASHGTYVGNIGAVAGNPVKNVDDAARELAVGSKLVEGLNETWERQRDQVAGGFTIIGTSGTPTLGPKKGVFEDGDGYMPTSQLDMPGAKTVILPGPHNTPLAHLWQVQYSGVVNAAMDMLGKGQTESVDWNAPATARAFSSTSTSTAAKASAPKPSQVGPNMNLREGKDGRFDGQFVSAGGKTWPSGTRLADVPGALPKGGVKRPGTLLYVNGIGIEKDRQARELQQIADQSGMKTVGLHNATNSFPKDLLQAAGDKLDVGHNPAVASLRQAVLAELDAGNPVHLMAHSHGGIITSRALFDVRETLKKRGLSDSQVDAKLASVRVETYGGAAGRYPNGPQYVHYVNTADVQTLAVGLGKGTDFRRDNAGRGAKFVTFRDFDWNPNVAHDFAVTYFPHRQHFEDARAKGK